MQKRPAQNLSFIWCMSDPATGMTILYESELTCPVCGHKKVETMPSDACQWFYECEHCHALLKPKQGDCCVFCSYGTVPCPPIQADRSCCSGWNIRTTVSLFRQQYPPVSAAVAQIHFVAAKLATEPTETKSYNLLFLLDYESVTTALDEYASKGWSQRISARERASEGGMSGWSKIGSVRLMTRIIWHDVSQAARAYYFILRMNS